MSMCKARTRARKGLFARAFSYTFLAGVSAAALLAVSVQAGNTAYGYDALGRVVSVTYSDGSTTNYTYDAAGNRTQTVRVPGGPVIQVIAVSNLRSLANAAGYAGATPTSYQFVVPSGTSIAATNGAGATIDTGVWPSGSTLALNIAGTVSSGTSSGDTGLKVQAPINVTLTGSLNNISLVTGATLGLTGTGFSVTGSGATVNLSGATSSMTMLGTNNIIGGQSGNAVTVSITDPSQSTWDYADTVTLPGGTLSVANATLANLKGDGATANMGNESSLAVFGNSTSVSGGSYTDGGYYGTYNSNGNNDSFTVAGSGVTFYIPGAIGTVGGFNNSIYGPTSGPTSITLNVSNIDDSWDYANNVYVASSTINLAANSQIRLYGAGNTVAMGNSASISLAGDNNTTTGELYGVAYISGNNETLNASGTSIYFENQNNQSISATINGFSNTIVGQPGSVMTVTEPYPYWDHDDTITMSSGTLTETAGSVIQLSGAGNAVNMGTNSFLSVTGDSNTITATGTGLNLSVSNTHYEWDDANQVTMSSSTLSVAANTVADLVGSSNTVTIGNGAAIAVTGNNNTITGGSGGNIIVDGTGDTVTVNNASITNNGGGEITIVGTGNTVTGQ